MKRNAMLRFGMGAMLATALAGCAVLSHDNFDGPRHVGAKYLDARDPSCLATDGIESADLQTAANAAVSRLLAQPGLTDSRNPPLYLITGSTFSSEGDSEFNTEAWVDLLRSELINAAAGRVRVLRKDADHAHADYAVAGRVTDVSKGAGRVVETYTQIAVEVIDLRTNEVAFSDLHAFKKAARRAGA